MTFDHDVRDELRAAARELLTDAAADQACAVPALDWKLLAEVGWLGLEVPESCAGAGAGFAEVAVVLQELGRARARSGYLGLTVLAVAALELLAPFSERDRLLTGCAAGEIRLAVALATGEDAEPPFWASPAADGMRVDGAADFVPDAPEADQFLLLARDPTGEPVLVRVRHDTPGLTVTPRPVLDETRSVAAVVAKDLEVSDTDSWHFGAAPESSAALLRCRAAVAVTCDSFGVAEAMLEETVAYAKLRHQFGRAIGSFQGVKFSCADALVALRVGGELLSAAVDSVADADPQAGCNEAEVAVARAKAFVCAQAVDIVGKALQLHGGIGYTWDSGIHVALKRVALNRTWFGSPATHRKRLARSFV
jgi:alkylation response protein AidB-like acyl-CoA dehydrogenase